MFDWKPKLIRKNDYLSFRPYTITKHIPVTIEKKVPYEVKVPIPQPYIVEKVSNIIGRLEILYLQQFLI